MTSMKNLWPEVFTESEKASAKNIIEEQAKLLSKITKGVVFADVEQMDFIEAATNSMENEFAFEFYIRGKFLEGYRFKVLSFSHDITLYPVKFRVDDFIAKEIGIKNKSYNGYFCEVTDQNDLERFLEKVLTSERMKNVIGSILKLSK
jgi:hypothetical protein